MVYFPSKPNCNYEKPHYIHLHQHQRPHLGGCAEPPTCITVDMSLYAFLPVSLFPPSISLSAVLSICSPFLHTLYLRPPFLIHLVLHPSIPSCGYWTQLYSRQTIWCTLLMTDPTWLRCRLFAVCVCVWKQVHADWCSDVVCGFNHWSRCTVYRATRVYISCLSDKKYIPFSVTFKFFLKMYIFYKV